MEARAVGPNIKIEVEASKEFKPLPGIDVAAKVSSIKNKSKDVQALYAEIEKGFKDTEQQLKDKKLPQEILDRHAIAVGQYETRKAEFNRLIAKLEQAANDNTAQQLALNDLGSFMAKHPNAKPHQYTDPNKLPFGAPSGKVREPMTTKAQYQASLFPPQYEKIMLASLSMNGIKLAQATLPEVPTAADLAESDDVQLTQAIRDQANLLQKNPVLIYNWVRNNIHFIPSYGSIQGADMTLQTKRGNAVDTASLLIALYRASGIAARFVYGTIDVPADKVKNWVGGVTDVGAAQTLLGQGGIPNVGLISGGRISTIRMEHVWVEAYVDYIPSRGAVNKNPNTWVPMDASFKQYQFTKGMDIKSTVPIDGQTLLTQLQQGATVDQTQGYVQNLNQANLQLQLTNHQTQVQNYINSQKTNATIGDVLGGQTIIAQNYSVLPGSLPYKTVATGSIFQTLPDKLRWKFKANIYAADGVATSESPIIEISQSTARLAGKKITLSFAPATQADQDLINSYLPKPHADGTPLHPDELPSSLPGYLLKVKAEFRIDGQVVAQSANSFTMGSSIRQASQYFDASTQAWDGGADNDVIAGEYNAIGIDLQGISGAQLNKFQTKLDATKAKLTQYEQNPADTTPIRDLTKEDLTGDIVQTAILSYFAQVDTTDNFISRSVGNVTTYRLPSYGRFFSAVQPYYFFGVVRSVTFPGVVMDVDYLRYHFAAHDGSYATTGSQFMRQAGAAGSAAENSVPEAMFNNRNLAANDPSQPQGVSAVKALALAAIQGQKIFTLDRNNETQHSAILQGLQISQDVKTEITNALAIGREVTVHEKDIVVNGWVGSGYIILDPEIGTGAYKIAGGANGGAIDDSYMGRYLTWVSANLISTNSPAIDSLILLVAPVMKYWFGFAPQLGSANPATTLIRALSLMLQGQFGFGIPFAAGIGRTLWPIAFFIGFYNVTILIQGFFYAKGSDNDRMNRLTQLHRSRKNGIV